MRVSAIGTAGGKTVAHKLTTFLVDDALALDAGSVCTGLTLEKQLKIQHVFLSHVHMDHVGELPLLVDNKSLHGQYLTVHATADTLRFLMENIFNGVIWPDFTKIPNPEDPALRFQQMEYLEPVQVGDYTVTALPVNHLKGSAGCHVSQNGSGLVFSSDTGKTDALWNYINGRDDVTALITECSFPARMEDLAVRSRHFSSSSLAVQLDKLEDDVKVYIYHLKPQFAEEIRSEIDQLDLTILQDGMFFNI